MIQVESLNKRYGDLVAVHEASFDAPAGAIFGLLGPNGAGKSTIIGCICGLLKPTAGRVRVSGHDVVTEGPASRRALGVVPQELALYQELSAAENLRFWGAAYGLRGDGLRNRVESVLTGVGLADRASEPVSRFSGGMKRRLNFACALVHRPRVLLLDEPTVGVDPQSRERLLDLVREQAADGACVLYTTHYMEEAESLCDQLAIVDNGRMLVQGTLAELRAGLGERDIVHLSGEFDVAEIGAALATMPGESALEVLHCDAQTLTLAMPEASRRLSGTFEMLARAGAVVRETTLTQPTLETLFLKLTGRALRDQA